MRTQRNTLEAAPVSTATYETLRTGAFVAIKLPKSLSEPQPRRDDPDKMIMHYIVSLRGGVVNIYVHSGDYSLAGRTIHAMVEVKIKTIDGRRFLLVDLHPVDEPVEPTHKLVVLPNTFDQLEHWEVFPTPGMNGFAALIRADEKLVPPESKKATAAPRKVKVEVVRAGGNDEPQVFADPKVRNNPFGALSALVGK